MVKLEMAHDCENCPAQHNEEKKNNENKYIVKYRVNIEEIGDYSIDEVEEKLNNTPGIKDAIINEDELIIDYDDILVSPKKIKKLLA